MLYIQWYLQGPLMKDVSHTLKSRYWCVILMAWVWVLAVLMDAFVVVAVVMAADDGLDMVVFDVDVQDTCAVAVGVVQGGADQDIFADVKVLGCPVLDDVFCHHGPAGHKASIFAAVDDADCAA